MNYDEDKNNTLPEDDASRKETVGAAAGTNKENDS